MSPRRFAVSHKRKRRGTRLDGSRITWKLNRAATVRLTIQRLAGSPKHRRWVRVRTIKRQAKKGAGVVRFRGRFGRSCSRRATTGSWPWPSRERAEVARTST